MESCHHQKKKKAKTAGNSISSSLIPVVDVVDEELVVDQILSRLPVKSLMRFKCVCKAWKFIIEHDSHLMDLHHAHSQSRLPGLLIIPTFRRISGRWGGHGSSFFSAELQCADDDDCEGGRIITGATIHRLGVGGGGGGRRVRSARRIFQYWGPVRGLLCLVDDRYAVRIYNVSTGQAVTPWIGSAVDMMKRKGYDGGRHLQLGFDPNTGKHKVVSIWNAPNGTPGVCEVLTVGVDTSWRMVDDVSPCRRHRTNIGACVNGSIYWITLSGDKVTGAPPTPTGFPEFLLAFDVGPEKFRLIGIPSFTYWGSFPFPYCKLLEMDGCLTVQCGSRDGEEESHTVKMWRFHDPYKLLQGVNANGTSSSSSSSNQQQTKPEDWSEVTIELPSCADPNFSDFYPIGKDLMILKTHISTLPLPYGFHSHVRFASFYSYNMINKTFTKFELHGIEEIPSNKVTKCALLAQSLFS